MKFSQAFLAAAVAGFAAAQDQCLATAMAIPSCGQACLTSAGSSYGCMYTDFACQCSNSAKINNAALTSCVTSACGDINTALSVSSAAEALCSCVSQNGGGSSGGSGAGTTTASIPATTVAMGSVTAAPATGSSSKAAMQTGASSHLSQFTGGAAFAAGSVGGVMAGLLGILAAL